MLSKFNNQSWPKTWLHLPMGLSRKSDKIASYPNLSQLLLVMQISYENTC